jgi:hypothetical protein
MFINMLNILITSAHQVYNTTKLATEINCFINCVRFEVFTVVTMKNAVFWDVTPCGSCKNQRLRGLYRLHYQGDKNWQARNVSS